MVKMAGTKVPAIFWNQQYEIFIKNVKLDIEKLGKYAKVESSFLWC